MKLALIQKSIRLIVEQVYFKIVITCKEQLDNYFASKLKKFTISLSFTRGTEFQRTVWKALQSIPYGETRSYKAIVTLIGNPKAIRAVGGANNKNRVIGSSGKLVGYAGGLNKKKMLLKLEGKK